MLNQPSQLEWLAVYLPLAICLLAACGIEFATTRIPNWLTYPLFLFLICMRGAIGPGPLWLYLVSALIGFLICFGIGFARGGTGGGAAKLAIATCAAFPPVEATALCLGVLLLVALFGRTQHWHGLQTYRGSIAVFGLAAVMVLVAAIFGKPTKPPF